MISRTRSRALWLISDIALNKHFVERYLLGMAAALQIQLRDPPPGRGLANSDFDRLGLGLLGAAYGETQDPIAERGLHCIGINVRG